MDTHLLTFIVLGDRRCLQKQCLHRHALASASCKCVLGAISCIQSEGSVQLRILAIGQFQKRLGEEPRTECFDS